MKIPVEQELQFMYKKYEELSKAYKALWMQIREENKHVAHDMGHMTFEEPS